MDTFLPLRRSICWIALLGAWALTAMPKVTAQPNSSADRMPSSLTFPILVRNDKIYVQMKTSIGRFFLLIDSGTERTLIFRQSVPRTYLNLEPFRTRLFGIGDSSRVVTIGQMPLAIDLPPWSSFHTLALLGDPLPVDAGPYDGILGLDFFRAYCVLLDRGALRMQIFPVGQCAANTETWTTVHVDWTRHAILVPLRVQFTQTQSEARTEAILDTGANLPLLLSNQYRQAAGLKVKHHYKTGTVKTYGANGVVRADVVPGAQYRLGNSTILVTTRVAVARGRLHPKAGIFANKALRFQSVLGNEVLSLVAIKFDALHRCIYLQVPKLN